MAKLYTAPIARHFWQNRERAVWQASTKFPDSLLAWLKINYAELVAGSRPQWIERPEGMLGLFFHDEHEIHGRMATRMVVCLIEKNIENTNEIYTELSENRELIHGEMLSISVHAKFARQAQSKLKNRFILFTCLSGVVAVVAAVAFYSVSGSKGSKPSITVSASVKSLLSMPENDVIKPMLSMHVKVKKSVNSICKLAESPKRCFEYFLSEKCQTKTTKSYNAWLFDLKKHRPMKFNGWSCPQSLGLDNDLNGAELTRLQRNALNSFLNNGGK